MPKYHLLRNYVAKSDPALVEFGLHVAGKMTGNPNFTPPVEIAPAQLTAAATNFSNAIAAQPDGGTQATAVKNAARNVLLALLDQLAAYVEFTADNDPVKLLSSGFELANAGHAPQAQVGTTSISAVTNLGSGIMGFEFTPASNSWAIEVQYSVTPGVWIHGETFTNPRDAQLPGLIPGTMYAFRARAFGSNNQRSAWSDPVSHMAT
jgi:hypothetical protein